MPGLGQPASVFQVPGGKPQAGGSETVASEFIVNKAKAGATADYSSFAQKMMVRMKPKMKLFTLH